MLHLAEHDLLFVSSLGVLKCQGPEEHHHRSCGRKGHATTAATWAACQTLRLAEACLEAQGCGAPDPQAPAPKRTGVSKYTMVTFA